MSKPLRKCKHCGLEALTLEDLDKFAPDRKSHYGKRNVCKKCRKQQRETPFPKPDWLRKCRYCGLEAHTEEDLEQFHKSPKWRYPHGRINLCKKCSNLYKRKWDRENPLFDRHHGMIARCYNPKDTNYARYGGRGITVCEEWRKDKQAFYDWALANGFKPELQIDRIDNDKGYSRENCRWATRSQQQLNKTNTTTFLEKGTRICYVCRIEKPFSEFNRSKTPGEHGYARRCRSCANKQLREYRLRINR